MKFLLYSSKPNRLKPTIAKMLFIVIFYCKKLMWFHLQHCVLNTLHYIFFSTLVFDFWIKPTGEGTKVSVLLLSMQQTRFHSAAGCKGNQTETSRNGRALLISPLNNSEAFSYLLETGRKNGTIRKSCYIIFLFRWVTMIKN